jgi:hypothetical protein
MINPNQGGLLSTWLALHQQIDYPGMLLWEQFIPHDIEFVHGQQLRQP